MSMAEVLVIIIIIISFAVKILMSLARSSEKEASQGAGSKPGKPEPVFERPKPNEPGSDFKKIKPNEPGPDFKKIKPNEPGPDFKKIKPNKPGPELKKVKPNVPAKHKGPERLSSGVLKARLVSGENGEQAYDQAAEPDILESAKEITREVAVENDLDALAAGDLMDRVFDLITKGPEDRIAFQRDFVGEGVEMLNRMAVPDSWEQT